MISVNELKTMTVEQSAKAVLNDLETRIIASRYIPDSFDPNLRVVDLAWVYPKEITQAIVWELLESGYAVKLYQLDGGIRIHIEYFV